MSLIVSEKVKGIFFTRKESIAKYMYCLMPLSYLKFYISQIKQDIKITINIFFFYYVFSLFKIFKGNSDGFSEVTNNFPKPLYTRYVRVHPESWSGRISMRIEFYGCRSGLYRF